MLTTFPTAATIANTRSTDESRSAIVPKTTTEARLIVIRNFSSLDTLMSYPVPRNRIDAACWRSTKVAFCDQALIP
jgi:hypothetical protein